MMKEVNIAEFAVELTIKSNLSPSDAKSNVSISQLLNEDNRVTFIRGTAGMGKSVLAKQVIYGWANGEIYTDFKLCIMIECRELNNFHATEGALLKDHEIISEYLKMRVKYSFGDCKGTLFVIDGLDELYDIHSNMSIIWQLLSSEQFRRSRIIITGRPHIEGSLERCDAGVGGLRILELQGISEEHIGKFIDKVASFQDTSTVANKMKSSIDKSFPVLHVPQFMNTVCCIAMLKNGEICNDKAEMYCWILYLMLKQHAEKHVSRGKTMEQVLEDHSESLLTLCEICCELLIENTVIYEQEIAPLFDDTGQGNTFYDSLFLDVSDDLKAKYQFKVESLMHFLHALHICNISNRMQIVKSSLDNNLTDVVILFCQLISGFSSEGIKNKILTNVASLTFIDEESIFKNILGLIVGCNLEEDRKVETSIQIILYWLNTNFKDIWYLTSIIDQLHIGKFNSNISKSILMILDQLEMMGKFDEMSIKEAFQEVYINSFCVDSTERLILVKY